MNSDFTHIIDTLPEKYHAEIINGTLWVLPAPHQRHVNLQDNLNFEIKTLYGNQQTDRLPWIIRQEMEIELFGDTSRVIPDLCGWHVDRFEQRDKSRAAIDIVPDWILEITSPRQESRDFVEKKDLYELAQVPYYWIIDLAKCYTEVHALNGQGTYDLLQCFNSEVVSNAQPFPFLTFNINQLKDN